MTTLRNDESCRYDCGYVGDGTDVLDHERYEHRPCPDCGGGKDRSPEWLEIHAVSHRPGCVRLQPDYVYPDRRKAHDCPMASTYATVDITNYCGHPSHGKQSWAK